MGTNENEKPFTSKGRGLGSPSGDAFETEGFLDSGYLQEIRFSGAYYLNAVTNVSCLQRISEKVL